MARTKVDDKLNVVVGTKTQVEGDTSIPENSIIVVTDEELKADEIAYSVEKNVKEAIEDLEANKADIVDNLTTNDGTKVLSAKQGKVLNDTTAKLSVKNTFTQPQVVPNATADNEAVNLGQLNDTIITALGNIDTILDSILGV